MVIKIYYLNGSPACRSAMLTLKALNISYEILPLSISGGENLKDEFIKKNPQHTIPTIEDDDFVIWDSHAINQYLVDKYSKGHSLYPTEPSRDRAVIHQRLYYDCEVLYPILLKISHRIMGGNPVIPQEDLEKVTKAYEVIEQFLERGTKYIATDDLTIADFSIITTLTTLNLFKPDIRDGKYPLTASYFARCKSSIVGYEEINELALKNTHEFFDGKFIIE